MNALTPVGDRSVHPWKRRWRHSEPHQPYLASNLMFTRHESGSVVLNITNGTYLELDASATEILELVHAIGEERAALTLVDRYGVDGEAASIDVAAVVHKIHSGRTDKLRHRWRLNPRRCAVVVVQWLNLPSSAKSVTLRTGALIVAVELAIRLFPIDQVAKRLGAPLSDRHQAATHRAQFEGLQLSQEEITRFAAIEWTLARWFFDGTCLRRSLARGWVLRSRSPCLHIGLISQKDIAAHAWLQVGDSTIGAVDGVYDFIRLC